MSSGPSQEIDRYKKVNDVAGAQVLICLNCRNAAEAWAEKLADMNLRENKSDAITQRVFKRMIQKKLGAIQKGPAKLKKLQQVFADRDPVAFDDRAAGYFHSLFEPLPDRACTLPDQNGLPMTYPGGLIAVLERVDELLAVEYLIKDPPQNWPNESKIFEKERLFGEALLRSPDFIHAVSAIKTRHANAVARLIDPVLPSLEYPQGELSSFMDDVAVLCGDLSLRGLTANLQPLPELFEIFLERKSIHVKVPSYMEFDWRRDLPVSVFRMLTKRGHFLSAVRPSRLHEQGRTVEWNVSDSDVYETYIELKPNLDKNDWDKNRLYDEINEICRISDAEGPDDRRRSVSRRLKSVLKNRKETETDI